MLASRLVAGLAMAGALMGTAHAVGEQAPGNSGTYTDTTPTFGFPNPSSFGVTVGECKDGFRVVTFINVTIFGKGPARFLSDSGTARIPCVGKIPDLSTVTCTVLADNLDANGNVVGTVKAVISVRIDEHSPSSTVLLRSADLTVTSFDTGLTLKEKIFPRPDRR